MKKLVIVLKDEEATALAEVATEERRTINQQSAYFVAQMLERWKAQKRIAKVLNRMPQSLGLSVNPENDDDYDAEDMPLPSEPEKGRYIHLPRNGEAAKVAEGD